jgi:hypothetical protein
MSRHQRRPVPVDVGFVPTTNDLLALEDEEIIDFVLNELKEDPVDVFIRVCAPRDVEAREGISRMRRAGRPRGGQRRRPCG